MSAPGVYLVTPFPPFTHTHCNAARLLLVAHNRLT
jgi:hypothetical protein